MSDEEKKKFFNNIEKTWKGKGAKNERFGRGDAQKKLNHQHRKQHLQKC